MTIRAFNFDRFVREVHASAIALITEGETDHFMPETAWGKLIRPDTGAGPLFDRLLEIHRAP